MRRTTQTGVSAGANARENSCASLGFGPAYSLHDGPVRTFRETPADTLHCNFRSLPGPTACASAPSLPTPCFSLTWSMEGK